LKLRQLATYDNIPKSDIPDIVMLCCGGCLKFANSNDGVLLYLPIIFMIRLRSGRLISRNWDPPPNILVSISNDECGFNAM